MEYKNITDIRNEIQQNVGRDVNLKANMGRRKMYESSGTIEKVYPSIFVVRLDNDTKGCVSFSYSDVLTKTVMISYKN
ncbi:Veg family protein [Proteiniclasticum sp. BAD-10]|jgi:uncharacterized protein Veg|uniref:Veg family protein n=1 Tax=Proteiniclasticum sediminis TaxID=2804028 RepID=A0A941HRK5_9CLOT|nr:Veg family protein [Proteiniclasticum sediminis]MBR0576703.1 Veg family protein [Proteiniclasticum sediminis]